MEFSSMEMDTRSTQWSPHINNLPEEVLLKVFTYLTPIYLSETVSKVCTQWEGLCGDPRLYKTLEFRQGEVNTDTAVKLLKVAPLLESLTLMNMNDIDRDKILEEVCQHNHKIRALVIEKVGECKSNFLDKPFYKNIGIQLPQLKILHLHYPEFCVSGAVEGLVNSCFDLEDLQLTFSTKKVISVIHSKEIIALCKRFYKTLRSFRVGLGIWTTEAFCELQKCDRLETLSIIEPHIKSFEDLLAVSSIPNLRRLELRLNDLPDESPLIQLLSSSGLTNLASLELRTHKINDQIAAAIGDHLKSLQTLTLNGFHNMYPDFVAHQLTSSMVKSIIKGCVMLLELNLHFRGIQLLIKEAIQLIPAHLPGLKKVLFSPCKYGLANAETKKAIAQIKISMPDLQLELA